jgi:cytoskeletal protein RodZ
VFYLTELGNRLKEAREAKRLSLDDLQNATKIQKRYLIGIEEGNYDMMPGKFYVRAFIKQYCEAVGLDPEIIVEEYKNDVPAVNTEELPAQLSRVKSRKSMTPAQSKMMEVLPKIIATIVVIGIIILIWIFVSNFATNATKDAEQSSDTNETVDYSEREDSPLTTEDETADSETKGTETDITEEPKPAEEEVKEQPVQELTAISSSGKNSTYQLKNAATFKVKVSSTGETWVNIRNGNGNSFYQGLLKASESQEVDFTKETEAVIVIGNAANTEIFVNDQKLEYAVPPNEIVTQTVTIQFTKSE